MTPQGEQIWTMLRKVGAVTGTEPVSGRLESPWYVKVLLAFSGWLAAIFLLGFIGIGFEIVLRNGVVAFTIGCIMVGAAFVILRIPKNEFIEHLGLAGSLAGQALIVFAIFYSSNLNEAFSWLLVALLQISLTVFMPSFIHRVFSSFTAILAFSMTITSMGLPPITCGLTLLLSALCWLNEFRYPRHMKKIRAIGYGAVLSLILLKGTATFGYSSIGRLIGLHHPVITAKPWIGELLLGAVAMFVVWQLLQRYNQTIFSRTTISSLLCTLLLCLVSLKVQGLTIGMVVMLLGFSSTNRVLLGLGVISLLFYISSYYYLLNMTLMDKSRTLFVAGVALLTVRWLMLRIFPAPGEAQHG